MQMLPKGQLIGTPPGTAGQICICAHLYEWQLLGQLLWWAAQNIGPQDLLYHPVCTLRLPISLWVASHTMQEAGT